MAKHKKKDILCRHLKPKIKDEFYCYEISKDEDLLLCKFCNATLAEKLLGQLATEVFIPKLVEAKDE